MDLAKFSLFQWYILIVAIYIILLFFLQRDYEYPPKISKFGMGLIVVAMSYLAAGRTGIGDTTTYTSFFMRMTSSLEVFSEQFSWGYEWGFQVFLFICKVLFGDREHLFLFACSFVIVGGVFSFFRKTSNYPELCVIVYMLSGSFVTGMNGVRQAMVGAAWLLSFRMIQEKRYTSYVLLCLALSTFHQSALIFLPLILLLNFEPWKRGTWALIATSVALYVAYPLFANKLTRMLEGSYYDMYSNGLLNFSNGGANIIRVFVYIVPVVLSYMYREQMEDDFEYFGVCLNGAILNMMFMLVASVRSWILARFCMYFSPFSIVLLAESIKCSGKNKALLYTACIVAYMVFFYAEMKSTIFLYSK